MWQRSLLTISLIAVAVLTCVGISAGQTEAKKALDFLEKAAAHVEKWKAEEFQRLRDDLKRQEAQWLKLKGTIEAIVLAGENNYIEAARKHEEAVNNYEAGPRQNPIERRLYIENLYELGGLYAEMCAYDKAEDRARKAWKEQLALDGTNKYSLAPRIRGLLTLAAILDRCDKPQAAAGYVDDCIILCSELPRALYEPEKNALLAACLLVKSQIANSTGRHHEAKDIAAQALGMLKAIGSKRHPDVAAALHNKAIAAIQLDHALEAFEYLGEALAILDNYYANGHPSRAAVHATMAQVYFVQGNEPEALKSVDAALSEYRRLFPQEKYPRGHPGLIRSLTVLGDLLLQYGRVNDALKYHREAWNMGQKLYAQAHINKLAALLSYGRSLRMLGQRRDALACFEQAEEMAETLDHQSFRAEGPNVAFCLVERGVAESQLGQLQAVTHLEKALALYKQWSPTGHPLVSVALQAQGMVSFRQGDLAKARTLFKQALTADQHRLAAFASIAAEAEALAFRVRNDFSYHGYLSAGRNAPEAGYDPIWGAKARVTRLLQKRHTATQLASGQSPEVRQLQEKLIDVRTQLSHVIVSVREGGAVRQKNMTRLEREKEDLERRLAGKSMVLTAQSGEDLGRSSDLAKRLPAGSVFVDLVYYQDVLQDFRPYYAAFVLTPGGNPRRVDLGLALPINRAIQEWRESVRHWQQASRPEQQEEWQHISATTAKELRRLVWEPIAAFFPRNSRLVYLAPDGDLARFPFAAMPGEKTDGVLLDEYMIAYVPHGPFLLEQLTDPKKIAHERGPLLIVGGVAYDTGDLPGTAEELMAAQNAAAGRGAVILQGTHATIQSLREALPLMSFAHLATHGFFAEKELTAEHHKIKKYLESWPVAENAEEPSVGLGRRSPLSYTGLVLAGPAPPRPPGVDDNILSGETIAELPLTNLRLAVLSACETGLGETTAGEGVQGLQRAFYLAGCPSVVASLWRVDDRSTSQLMAEFYHRLWDDKKTPLEALCLAQRQLIHNPLLAMGDAKTAHPRYWAGFVYYGAAASLSISPDDSRLVSADEPPSPAPLIPWVIAGTLILGFAALVAIYWLRKPMPVATILGPADDPTSLSP